MRNLYPEKGMLQKRAEQCRHIADGIKDVAIRQRLQSMARDYERMAAEASKLKRGNHLRATR